MPYPGGWPGLLMQRVKEVGSTLVLRVVTKWTSLTRKSRPQQNLKSYKGHIMLLAPQGTEEPGLRKMTRKEQCS